MSKPITVADLNARLDEMERDGDLVDLRIVHTLRPILRRADAIALPVRHIADLDDPRVLSIRRTGSGFYPITDDIANGIVPATREPSAVCRWATAAQAESYYNGRAELFPMGAKVCVGQDRHGFYLVLDEE
jgi:hypothetical protein